MKPFQFRNGRHLYEIRDSAFGVKESKIFLLNPNTKEVIKEITDEDKKYKLLQIARAAAWEINFPNACNPKSKK